MDELDRRILRILQQDASISVTELAEQVNLSVTPCWKRIKRFQETGIIKSRVALLDAHKLALGVSVFVHLKTQQHDNAWLAHFSEQITAFEEVVECYRMAGEWDYLLRVVVSDIEAFDRFYKRMVKQIDGLSDVTSSFAMEEIKYTTRLPI